MTLKLACSTQSEKAGKLCPRHRVPSMCCSSSSSNSEDSIKTVSIKKLNRRKYSRSFSIDIEKSQEKLSGITSFERRNKTLSSSLPSKANYFNKDKTERKLRRYKVNYNKSIINKNDDNVLSTSLDNLNKERSDDDSLDSDSELKNSYEIIHKKKIRSNDFIIVNKETKITKTNQLASRLSEINEINLDFSLIDDTGMIKNHTDNHDDDEQNEQVEQDLENYLDKFELNIFGNI